MIDFVKDNGNQLWWLTNVRNKVARLYNDESMADVHFLVGNSEDMQKIPAHKFVLAVGSSVFETMFYGSLPEKDEIKIPDIEPQGFLTLLKFLYCCDEIKLNDDNVLFTLYAAKKYQVEHVINICLNYVEINLNGKNAWLFLTNWELFDGINIVQRCWEIIIVDTKSALESEVFPYINKETLQKFLNCKTLNCTEVDIFKAVVKWVDANHSCEESITNNKKNILGDLKYLIRVPTMTLEEFTNIVINSGLLSLVEIVSIFIYYTAEKKPDLNYSTVPRTRLQLRSYSNMWICFSPQSWNSSTNIRAKNSTFITSLNYNLSSTTRIKNLNSSLEIKRKNCVVARQNFTVNYVSNINQFQVNFKHPVRLRSNWYYTISIKLVGSTSELHFNDCKQNSNSSTSEPHFNDCKQNSKNCDKVFVPNTSLSYYNLITSDKTCTVNFTGYQIINKN